MSIGFFFIWMFVQIKKRTKKLCQEKPTVSLRAAFTFCMSLVCVTKLCMKCVAWTVNLIGPINTRRPPSPRRESIYRAMCLHTAALKSRVLSHIQHPDWLQFLYYKWSIYGQMLTGYSKNFQSYIFSKWDSFFRSSVMAKGFLFAVKPISPRLHSWEWCISYSTNQWRRSTNLFNGMLF